jgi:hypothetical protein
MTVSRLLIVFGLKPDHAVWFYLWILTGLVLESEYTHYSSLLLLLNALVGAQCHALTTYHHVINQSDKS